MQTGPIVLQTTDQAPIYKGSTRKVKATFTDASDVAAVPTEAKLIFINPVTGASTIYAKTPEGDEVSLTMSSSNVAEVDFTFTDAGTWKVVAKGLENMNEVKPAEIYVEDSPA